VLHVEPVRAPRPRTAGVVAVALLALGASVGACDCGPRHVVAEAAERGAGVDGSRADAAGPADLGPRADAAPGDEAPTDDIDRDGAGLHDAGVGSDAGTPRADAAWVLDVL
jgi:hypothetical protein